MSSTQAPTVTSTSFGGIIAGGWQYNDLTIATGAPVAQSNPMGYVDTFQSDTQHIVYNSVDHQIIDLTWEG